MSECEDIIMRFISLLAEQQPSISESFAENLERQLRHEYGGTRVPKRRPDLHLYINKKFNGKNADKLARELRVSKRTVQRAVYRKPIKL